MMNQPNRIALLAISLILWIGNIDAQDFSNIGGINVFIAQPKVSFDGSTLVYMADYDGKMKLYLSVIQNGTWMQPTPVFTEDINNEYEISFPQLSFDNRSLYFSAKRNGANSDIYLSERINGVWSPPVPITGEINSGMDEESPAVSANGKIILFTRPAPADSRLNDYCKTIFITEMSEIGTWSTPRPLKSEYNTGCVNAPYYSIDNKTFYFSSTEDVIDAEGKKISKNTFNIYWAKIDGLFQYNPKVVSQLVNPESDQISVSIDQNNRVYYAQGDIYANEKKRNSTIVANDLNLGQAPEAALMITGRITDVDGNNLSAEISVVDPYTSKVLQSLTSDENGFYQVFVPFGSQFSIVAMKQGYSVQSKLSSLIPGESSQMDFQLFPEVTFKFNVFDEEFYFPLDAEVVVTDNSFQVLNTYRVSAEASQNRPVVIPIGEELNVLFRSDDYHVDTLVLPFDKEVLFSEFDFDVELKRRVKRVNLTFSDSETSEGIGLELTVYNVTRNEKVKRKVKDGKISLDLRDGETYEISTSAQGYSYFSATYDMKQDDIQDGTTIGNELQSIKNASIVLNNITFEYNSFSLNADSYLELNKLVEYLRNNSDYKVEISAHTDDKGAETYNLQLSKLRANSVMEYLQDHGIRIERLLSKGLGESQPLVSNDSDENRAKNRRVEFKIINSNG